MNKTLKSTDHDMCISMMKVHLVQAQSFDIMIDKLIPSMSSSSYAAEFAEILEEISNIYMDISEKIAERRADPTIFIPESRAFGPEEETMPQSRSA